MLLKHPFSENRKLEVRMKINWGIKLIIGYSIFVVITLGMIFFTTTLNTDKVIDNYYEAEINYQQHIDKIKRTNK